jgi:hypothetical protein
MMEEIKGDDISVQMEDSHRSDRKIDFEKYENKDCSYDSDPGE